MKTHTAHMTQRRVYVLVLPDVHALDFGGPVQTIAEANSFGANYDMQYVGVTPQIRSAQGFTISELKPLPDVTKDDWILVPGTESTRLDALDVPSAWLRSAVACGARVTSVCSGAFALGFAGVLDGRECTTHWKILDRMQDTFPTATVLDNRLYVRDGNVVTSAGVASGIDMALHLVEEDFGPRVASRVAREMVVYVRRGGEAAQHSIYLEHRAHLHPAVHRVQDYIVEHPEQNPTLQELAAVATLSPRHLTRVFRDATGTTLKAFAHKVKLEVARNLLEDYSLTIEDIAARCGFEDARQLRRLWRQHFQSSVSQTRKETARQSMKGHYHEH